MNRLPFFHISHKFELKTDKFLRPFRHILFYIRLRISFERIIENRLNFSTTISINFGSKFAKNHKNLPTYKELFPNISYEDWGNVLKF